MHNLGVPNFYLHIYTFMLTLLATVALHLPGADSTKPLEDTSAVSVVHTPAVEVRATTEVSTEMVSTVSSLVLSGVQARSLADGLQFAPGLRIEQTCQNCGFTQVRLQGLAGPYTQILINSRPIFSALNSVYGLEHIPASFIDRIIVTRGAGSVLFGAGAIAGAVDVVTQRPDASGASASIYREWYGSGRVQQGIDGSATWRDRSTGSAIRLMGSYRNRDWFDRNADGFTELPSLSVAAGGVQGSLSLTESSLLRVDGHWIREHRRGGEITAAPPQDATVAEDLDHSIAGGSVTYEWAHPSPTNGQAQWDGSLFASALITDRSSYYGGGAAAIAGLTAARSGVAGTHFRWNGTWASAPLEVLGGSEYRYEEVEDRFVNNLRNLSQRVHLGSVFSQVSSTSADGRLHVRAGVRTEAFWMTSSVRSDAYHRLVVNPRFAATYQLDPEFHLRATYGMGFRGPQTFDEDLHISTLQGSPRAVRLSPTLDPERSQSVGISMIWNRTSLSESQQATVDAFATMLSNPFMVVLGSAEPDQPVLWANKINGPGAYVVGLNAELQLAHIQNYEVSLAMTAQQSRYVQQVDVASSDDQRDPVRTITMLRTPEIYGSMVVDYQPWPDVWVNVSAILTGPMMVLNERERQIHRTPWFVDAGIHVRKQWDLGSSTIQLSVGVVNIVDQFQRDVEVGPDRDAAYTYGPLRPRTFSIQTSVEL